MPVAYEQPVLWYAVMVGAVAIAVLGLRLVGTPLRRVGAGLDDRFVYGIPWGTIVVVLAVLSVYLFVQRGLWDWHRPVVVRYMAFSLFEPVGWGFAGLAHAGPNHLISNLTTTLVFGPIVEYAWGHYPARSAGRWGPAWTARPTVRAVVLFPVATLALGVVAGLVMWGPVIGFSFVVFALLGCSLVNFPVITLAAVLGRTAVRVVYRALVDPVTVAETTTRVVRPGWYGTAVQGHLFGLLVGVVVGAAILRHRHRDRRPSPGRVWIGACVLGMGLSLWAFWWVLGPERFIVFRALGVGFVVLVATVIAVIATDGSTARLSAVDRPPREVALAIVFAVILAMSLVGLGLNAVGVGSTPNADGIHVDGYEVFYAENVSDETFGAVDLSALGLTTGVETSGVIVQSEERRLWYRTVPAVELRTHGVDSFRLGDLGWSTRVRAARLGWEPVDNRTVYAVWLDAGQGWEHVWDADPSRASPVVAGHTFEIVVRDGDFFIDVERAGEVERVPIPSINETIDAHGVTLRRVDGDVYASFEDTEVRIARRETYDD